MGKHSGTSPKRGWYITSRMLLAVIAVLIVMWSYQFVGDHPDVWGYKSPRLHEGLAMIVVILAPLSALAFAADRIFRRKARRRAVAGQNDEHSTQADLVSK